MDVNYTALVRKQIEDMTKMQKELKRELSLVNAEIQKIDKFLNQKIPVKDKVVLQEHKQIYKQNSKDIEYSLTEAEKIINRLRLEVKPRAYIQVTKKLF